MRIDALHLAAAGAASISAISHRVRLLQTEAKQHFLGGFCAILVIVPYNGFFCTPSQA